MCENYKIEQMKNSQVCFYKNYLLERLISSECLHQIKGLQLFIAKDAFYKDFSYYQKVNQSRFLKRHLLNVNLQIIIKIFT